MRPKWYEDRKRYNRLVHLMDKFKERLKVNLTLYDIDSILEQINKDPKGCFLLPGNKPWVGIYKVRFKDYDIIVVSDRKHIFTTYGKYKGNKIEEIVRRKQNAISKKHSKLQESGFSGETSEIPCQESSREEIRERSIERENSTS